MASQNYYDILGVSKYASPTEIKVAYRTLAQQYHPDKHSGNPLSELASDRFRQIKKAYDTLSDPDSRRQYDREMGINGSNHSSSTSSNNESEIQSLIEQRLFADAHDLVDRLLRKHPKDQSLHTYKAYIYVEQGNNYSAIDSFDQAVQYGLNDPDVLFVFGVTLIEMKRFTDAISIIQKVIDIRGEVPNYFANLAIAYELDGQVERAKQIWNRLETIDPNNPILHQRKEVWKVGGNYVNKKEAANNACCLCILLECVFDCC